MVFKVLIRRSTYYDIHFTTKKATIGIWCCLGGGYSNGVFSGRQCLNQATCHKVDGGAQQGTARPNRKSAEVHHFTHVHVVRGH